jgi:hypothetical protein
MGSFTESPLFILGSERSGTTLLRLMLTSHPEVCIPPESIFYINLRKKYYDCIHSQNALNRFIDELYKDEKFLEWKVPETELRKYLNTFPYKDYPALAGEIYNYYAAKNKPQATIVGDKNPHFTFHASTLFHDFPRAKVLLIVRDVRAVYNSVKKKFIQDGRSRKKLIGLITDRWKASGSVWESYRSSSNFCVIRYEDLLTDPETILEQICRWLGINFDREMMLYHQKNRLLELVPKSQVKWLQLTFSPVEKARMDAWKHELNSWEAEAIEIMNESTLRRFGYAIDRRYRWRGRIWLMFWAIL